jgi:hypothetical protein
MVIMASRPGQRYPDNEPGTMERIRIQVWPAERADTIVLKQWHPPGT